MLVKTDKWDFRDAWPLASGEVAVRPSFSLLALDATEQVVAGQSVRNPRGGTVNHYLAVRETLTDNRIWLHLYDEDFVLIQKLPLSMDNIPRAFSVSVLGDEVLICSPDFDTKWGFVGGPMMQATKVSSVNPGFTALEVPRGISVTWAGRVVVSDGEALYFSDALYPRTFVAENIINPPGGSIYGMHVSAGGALVLVTSDGVYALPEDASAAGQVVLGVFSKLSDYRAPYHECSVACRGRVFGVSEDGFRLVDEANSKEFAISEAVLGRESTKRIDESPYNSGARLLSWEYGPIVAAGDLVRFTSLDEGFGSWWTPSISEIRCVLEDLDGSPLFGSAGGVFCLVGNNPIGGYDSATTVARVAGRINLPPDLSPVLREVTFASDCEGAMRVFVSNEGKSTTPTNVAPLCGSSTWGGAGLVYQEPPIRSRRFLFARRGDEVTLELSVTGHPARLPMTADVVFKGPGKRRPTG